MQKELAERMMKFSEMDALPIELSISKLCGEYAELSESLCGNSAKFHKSCKLKLAPAKFDKLMSKVSSSSKSVDSTPIPKQQLKLFMGIFVCKNVCD